jgi:flagellar hook-associated protein 3 FlgL
LQSANDILIKIQEMAVSQSSATASSTTREEQATALQPLIDELLSLANSKIGDSYIFSGSRTNVKPFEEESGAYAGGAADAADGNTYGGAVTASGTYTGAANATYVLKIIAGGNLNAATYKVSADGGKTWGAVSAAGDMSTGDVTIGSGLTLTFAAGTFGADDIFSVDAYVAGRYRGNGDDLALNIGKDNNFSYSISGESAFTDKGEGTVDIFGALADLKTALETNDVDGIRNQLDNLNGAQSQVTRYQAQCGTRTNSLEVTKSNYDALNESVTSLMSNIEDADVTQLITDFKMKEVALEASYSMAGQIGNISVLDFLK